MGNCNSCGGSQKCPRCDGTGHDPQIKTSSQAVPLDCLECGGTGKCQVCKSERAVSKTRRQSDARELRGANRYLKRRVCSGDLPLDETTIRGGAITIFRCTRSPSCIRSSSRC